MNFYIPQAHRVKCFHEVQRELLRTPSHVSAATMASLKFLFQTPAIRYSSENIELPWNFKSIHSPGTLEQF